MSEHNKQKTLPAWAGKVGTSTGRILDIVNCVPGDFMVEEEIAGGLSVEPRFGGALRREFRAYTVAQHSCYVSMVICPDPLHASLEALQLGLAGHLHDSAEGIGLKDIVSPVKILFPEYGALEDEILKKLAIQHNLAEDIFNNPVVKAADGLMLLLEAKRMHPAPELFGGSTDWTMESIDSHFYLWPQLVAEARFIERYRVLKYLIATAKRIPQETEQ